MLKAQLARMLARPEDRPRSPTAFPRQWLQLRLVGMFPPDKKLYPDYDDYLQKSMVAETTAFFREVLDQNLQPSRVPRFRLDDAQRPARANTTASPGVTDDRLGASTCGRRIIAAAC